MATTTAEIVAQPQPDLAAFREWMNPFEAKVYGLALNLTGNAQDAEAVLLETFVRAGKEFARRRDDQRNYSWLARLAVREALRMLRSSRGDLAGWIADQTTTLEDREREVSPWVENAEALFAPQQWRRILLAALATLSPMDRAVFVLRELEKFSDEEAAALLSIERFDVRLRLNRARVSLRDRLDPVCRVSARFVRRPRTRALRRAAPLAPRQGLHRAIYL